MSASAPNPSNLLLLGALGIGAYWLMTRPAAAAPAPLVGTPSRDNRAATIGAVVEGLVGGLFGRNRAPATTAAGFIGEGVPSGIPAWDDAYRRALRGAGVGVGSNPVSSVPASSSWGEDFGASTGEHGAWV